jgi:hypothetical protein
MRKRPFLRGIIRINQGKKSAPIDLLPSKKELLIPKLGKGTQTSMGKKHFFDVFF